MSLQLNTILLSKAILHVMRSVDAEDCTASECSSSSAASSTQLKVVKRRCLHLGRNAALQ